jgi:uncharacterized protein YndB with AHSA1/START domain
VSDARTGKIEPIRLGVTVPHDPAAAFERFAVRLGEWWPREYTWAQSSLQWIGIDASTGACFELGPHGFRCDWGRVLAWDPARRLQIAWQISPRREPVPDPDRASEVEVVFAPVKGGSRVSLEHRAFDRHGEGAAEYRDAMASPRGWPYILARYAEWSSEEAHASPPARGAP